MSTRIWGAHGQRHTRHGTRTRPWSPPTAPAHARTHHRTYPPRALTTRSHGAWPVREAHACAMPGVPATSQLRRQPAVHRPDREAADGHLQVARLDVQDSQGDRRQVLHLDLRRACQARQGPRALGRAEAAAARGYRCAREAGGGERACRELPAHQACALDLVSLGGDPLSWRATVPVPCHVRVP